MTHRDTAIAFLEAVTRNDVTAAYERYVHPDFTHHNAYFPADRESLRKGMEESGERFPNKEYTVLRSFEDGELVAVHGRLILAPGVPAMSVVHMFRFQDGLIVEEWEAGQQVPEDSPNENGVF